MFRDQLFPRFAVPMICIVLTGALVTYAVSWRMHADLTESALKARADVVLASLTASAERFHSAYELMEYVEELGSETVGLEHVALVEDASQRIVAATEDEWLGKRLRSIPHLRAGSDKVSWFSSETGEYGIRSPVRIENHAIESLAGREHTAVIVVNGTSLVQFANRIKWLMMGIFGIAGAGLTSGFLFLLRRRVLLPINNIHKALESRSDSHSPLRLPNLNQDELGRLGKYLQKSLAEVSEVSEDLLVMTRAIEGGSSEVYVIDANQLTILSCNKAACANLGTTEDKVVGAHISLYAPDSTDPEVVERLSTDLAETGEANYTYTHKRADGTEYPFEFKSLLVFGRQNVLVVIGNDVSERVAQEEALLRSEKRMQLALTGSNDGLFDIDVADRRIYLSDQVREWTGLKGDEIYPKDFYNCVSADFVDRVKSAFAKAIETDGEINIEFQLGQHTLGGRWLQARGQVQEGADGTRHMSGFASDITSRKVAENLVYASVSRLGAVLDNIADGIVTLTEDGVVCTVNPAAIEMLGCDKMDITDTKLDDVVRLVGRSDMRTDQLERSLSDAEVKDGKWTSDRIDWAEISDGQVRETLTIRADSVVLISEISVTSMEGVGEERYTVVLRDISERKEHELALRTAMEDAQAATRAKGDFLATMSHEIRTPMNGVLGMTQLLLDMDLTPNQKETALTIFSSGESLLSLINDILDFSKIEAGKLELEQIPFDLRTSIKDVMDLTGSTARLKSLDLYIDYPDTVSHGFQGDVGRIRQVLLNLVGNAIKFTASGHVLVKVGELSRDGDEREMRISIHDSGPGVAVEAQAGLFEAFTQADTSTTRKYGGTGLGLAICKQLVELMGGSIGLNSQPGEGSEFYFTLPLLACDREIKVDDPNDDRLAGKRMLVVDDNPIGLRIGCELGRSFGMQVADCIDPLKVMEMLESAGAQEQPYDVLALDYHMPGLDGLTLATNVRGDERYDDLKIVMLTSSDIKRPPGLDGYTLKPLMRSGLKRLLLEALFGAQNQESAAVGVKAESDLVAAGVRVLVAEDNPVNQRVATRMLEKLGCRVDVAADGREAVNMWQQFDYSIVFMDCQMPELDGFGATREIRALEQEKNQASTPIVAMTANAMTQDKQECLDAGMDDYASKPVKLDLLQAMVVKWSHLSPSGAAPKLH